MENSPAKKNKNDITVTEQENLWPTLPFSPFQNLFSSPFIRFSISRTHMSSDGKTTEIRAEEHLYEKGRLESKRFKGEMAGDIFSMYSKLMEQQMSLFLKSFSLFLPFK